MTEHSELRRNTFILGSYDEKCKLTSETAYSDENVNFPFGSCNKILATESLDPAYIEDSCNNKNLCLYKDIANYELCKTSTADGNHEFINQADNNNFNITYGNEANSQYASCSNHNISMISSACYNNSTLSYSNVTYNAVYPIKDVNKNYGDVSVKI